jgi:hypothetical protein
VNAKKKTAPKDEPEQLALGGLPTGGRIVPMEAPEPSWPQDAWDVLEHLQLSSGPHPRGQMPRDIGGIVGISEARALAALRLLAANNCARYEGGMGGSTVPVGWLPTASAKLVWREWGQRRIARAGGQ